jgi:hypothetical protein
MELPEARAGVSATQTRERLGGPVAPTGHQGGRQRGREVCKRRHYRDLGWPLKRVNRGYEGCRPVAGIIEWTDHCVTIYIDPAREPLIVDQRTRTRSTCKSTDGYLARRSTSDSSPPVTTDMRAVTKQGRRTPRRTSFVAGRPNLG